MILLLGCDQESNTTLHHVEELVGVDYHLQALPVRGVIRYHDRTETRDYWVHQYGTPRNFNVIDPLLMQRGIQTQGRVGAATARLIAVGPLVSLGADVLRAAPRYFVRQDSS
jgi:aminoglycoside 3-N-acetyltransferase